MFMCRLTFLAWWRPSGGCPLSCTPGALAGPSPAKREKNAENTQKKIKQGNRKIHLVQRSAEIYINTEYELTSLSPLKPTHGGRKIRVLESTLMKTKIISIIHTTTPQQLRRQRNATHKKQTNNCGCAQPSNSPGLS